MTYEAAIALQGGDVPGEKQVLSQSHTPIVMIIYAKTIDIKSEIQNLLRWTEAAKPTEAP